MKVVGQARHIGWQTGNIRMHNIVGFRCERFPVAKKGGRRYYLGGKNDVLIFNKE